MNVDILIRCYEYNDYTERTIDSIKSTAKSNFNIIINPNKASAPENSNILINKSKADFIILMDDDLDMCTDGWDVNMINSHSLVDNAGCVAPQLVDKYGKKIGPQPIPEENSIYSGGELWGAILLFKDIGIRYDENYIKTVCDDTDFLYQWRVSGKNLIYDTRNIVMHKKECTSNTDAPWVSKNRKYFNSKWKSATQGLDWGQRVKIL